MGSAVALEHKLAEARQEAETERCLTLQLREEIAAAEVCPRVLDFTNPKNLTQQLLNCLICAAVPLPLLRCAL